MPLHDPPKTARQAEPPAPPPPPAPQPRPIELNTAMVVAPEEVVPWTHANAR